MDVLHPDGPYAQGPTGMVFPTTVGDFRRVNVTLYNKDGTDESAGYNRMQPLAEIAATVYVFRSPPILSIGSPQNVIDEARSHLCEQQFHGVEQEVMSAHPDAKLTEAGPFSFTQGANTHTGYRATYQLTTENFFGRRQASRSDAYVFCYAGGKWTVEYRYDYPDDYDANGPLGDFMRDLEWTIPAEQ